MVKRGASLRVLGLRPIHWACGTIATVLLLRYLSAPFVWISSGWGVLLLFGTRSAATPLQKALGVNLGVVLLFVGLMETVLHRQESPIEYSYSYKLGDTYFATPPLYIHDTLGYAPTPNGIITHTARIKGETLFEATYTINAKGLRDTYATYPSYPDARECVLFLGDSLVFGEGVSDSESLPAVVARLTLGRYLIYNFGYHGYGPHQMLAVLDSGLADSSVTCAPRVAIYVALATHVWRSAGLESWDVHGPKYELAQDGGVVRSGHFDDHPSWRGKFRKWEAQLPAGIADLLRKSATWKTVMSYRRHVNDRDLEVNAAIVAQASRHFETRHASAKFLVLYWDCWAEPLDSSVRESLIRRGLKLEFASEALADCPTDYAKYALHPPHDWHPNKAAYEKLARYIVDRMLPK